MEAACCPLLASLLCFCFPSFNAGFVAVWRMSGARERYANRTALQCQPGVCVCTSVCDALLCGCICVQTSMCSCVHMLHIRFPSLLQVSVCIGIFQVRVDECYVLSQVRVCVWALHGHWLYSPEPSFHSEKAVAGKKPFGQLLFNTNHSCCWLKRPGISSMGWHPFKPANRTLELTLWVSKYVLQDLKVWRTKHLFWQWTWFCQKLSPLIGQIKWGCNWEEQD